MSATATATESITGWTLETPPGIDCSFTDASGKWEQGRWAGTQAYDLGLGAATRCAWRPACGTRSRFTFDHELIEMCIPADWDTMDTEPPQFEIALDAKAQPR